MEEKADASKSLLVVLNDEMAIEFLDLGAMGRRNRKHYYKTYQWLFVCTFKKQANFRLQI